MSVRVIDFACVSSIFLPQSETVMNVCLLTIWVYWQVGKTCIEGVSDHLEYFIEKTEPVCNSVFCSVSMICISFNNLHIAHRFYIVSFSKQEKCVVVLCVRFGCICVCIFHCDFMWEVIPCLVDTCIGRNYWLSVFCHILSFIKNITDLLYNNQRLYYWEHFLHSIL